LAAWSTSAEVKFEEQDGIVSIEAENCSDCGKWKPATDKSGYSGDGFMAGGGGAGAMKYEVYFHRKGTYWVHLRAWASNEYDNGAYVKVDGQTATGKIYLVKSRSWKWWATKQGSGRDIRISFDMKEPGWHTVSVSPGVASDETCRIDKICIHLNDKYDDSGSGGITGTGPAETIYGGSTMARGPTMVTPARQRSRLRTVFVGRGGSAGPGRAGTAHRYRIDGRRSLDVNRGGAAATGLRIVSDGWK
jgi:hypothetical protein